MAEYTFKRLSEVEALAEVPEGANAFIEIDGEIKRVSGDGLGGAGGIKTAIIKSSDYDEAIATFLSPSAPAPMAALETTYECINMTFEEAYETMANGEPLNCVLMIGGEGAMNIQGASTFLGISIEETPCLSFGFGFLSNMIAILYWTSNGLSTEAPIPPK